MTVKCPKCHTENPSDSKFCKECATPLPSAEEIEESHTKTLETPQEELTTGSTFAGRYQIIEELGKGGMGRVYKVLDKKIKEKIALKLIKPEIASDKKTIERFSNELRFTRKIRHKNICQMFDLGEEKGSHFITMEFMEGQDLKKLIKQSGQLAMGTIINIAKQVCDGLAQAHVSGVVHRDLKPSNIMIDAEGNVRIMDFGIARSLKSKGITGAGMMIGTPEYMSPEQVEGKEVDQRSDIYSLGIILFEMVTGQVPFEGDTPFTIGVKHKSETPKNPKEVNSQLPDDLSHVILKCLEKDKEKRFQNAKEVHTELENIEKGIPTTERKIPKRTPLTSREITVQFNLKKLFVPASVLIAVVLIGLLVWHPWSIEKVTSLSPSGKPSLAIVYFENNTGDENLEYLRSGLAEWLITDLSQSKFIHVLSGDKIYGILKNLNLIEEKKYSSDDLSKVAREGGASHTMKGSFIKIGENFVITVMLLKPHTGEVISSREVRCEGEDEIPPKIDELTKMIKSDLNLSAEQIASDIDKKVGKITTSSPEALRYYSEGRKFHGEGNYRKSIQLMKKAIEIDPEFALAYLAMGYSYNNLNLKNQQLKYNLKALELGNRLPERERYLIQGSYYMRSEATYDKAIKVFEKLIQLYPEDLVARHQLGFIYFLLEEWDESIEIYEVCKEKKSVYAISYANLSHAYMAKGLYERAIEVLEYYIENISKIYYIFQNLIHVYICRGNYELASVELDKAFSLNPTHILNYKWIGDINLYEGDIDKAKEEYMNLLEAKEFFVYTLGINGLASISLLQGRFNDSVDHVKDSIEVSKRFEEKGAESECHSSLAYRYLILGDSEKALDECDKAWASALEADDLAYQIIALHYKGLIYLEINSMREAQMIAEELKDLVEKGLNKKNMRYYCHLMGMIDLKKNDIQSAIEYFKEALSVLPSQYFLWPMLRFNQHALFIEPLALAYYKAGELNEAQEEYERIISLSIGRILYGDIYAKSFYMIGRINEQQGNTAKAIEHYKKFLDLWKDADPGISEVEDARKRLGVLQGE